MLSEIKQTKKQVSQDFTSKWNLKTKNKITTKQWWLPETEGVGVSKMGGVSNNLPVIK